MQRAERTYMESQRHAERILSLLPSATEIAFDLGLGRRVQGVSHTCDYPEEATRLPVATRSLRDSHATQAGMTPVRRQAGEGVSDGPVFALDVGLVKRIQPDLVLTQDICEVCAIGSGTVMETISRAVPEPPEFLTISASGLDDILGNIVEIGAAAGAKATAERRAAALRSRMEETASRGAERGQGQRVLCVEWGDPLRAAGLWVPEMVEMCGGSHGFIGPRQSSRPVSWEDVARFAPEVILVMPCGYDLGRCWEETGRLAQNPVWADLPAVANEQVYVFDGRVPSRHGPRLFDVLEAFAEILLPAEGGRRWDGPLYRQWQPAAEPSQPRGATQ